MAGMTVRFFGSCALLPSQEILDRIGADAELDEIYSWSRIFHFRILCAIVIASPLWESRNDRLPDVPLRSDAQFRTIPMNRFAAPIAERIWDMKYRFRQADGTPCDLTVEDTWRRVASELARVEAVPEEWEDRFFAALEGFRFLPAGRILAGAGTGRDVTLFNCFVMGTIPDSIEGIFGMLREAALTMQQGGGIGYDFSTVRPKGSHVKGVAAEASGPLSFMDVWDAMCRTIMSAGSRRGAMMAVLRCDHPDIEAFVAAKSNSARLRMFNLSVLATDSFMEAVKEDHPWDLRFDGTVYRTVKARELWNRIMRSTYDFAEPGVVFIDRVNAANNLGYVETISATNPCGEQPLPPYGACLLGSINLARLVHDPFSANASLDETTLVDLVSTAVRMMDNVVDVSGFPLPEQEAEARSKRRIGLGVTGLANALMMTGLCYGTHAAALQTENWMRLVARAAYLASVELAREKGPFPLFDADRFLDSGTMQAMDSDVRAAVRTHGIRNALLTSIAPTGTISLYAGNVSSGIEPVFAYSYRRKVLLPDGSHTGEEVVDYAVQLWRDRFGNADLPDWFVNAQMLAPLDHVRMQAAAQKWVDSSISKTINCPEDIDFDAFQNVYLQAWDAGCKGCTTYRPNDVTGAVLSTRDGSERMTAGGEVSTTTDKATCMTKPLDRPQALEGTTYKLKWPDSGHAIYVTINDTVADGHRRPFEIFINSKNMEHYAWTVALTRMISAVFRRGGDVSFVVEELKAVFDPRGGAWMDGKYIPSILAAIGGVVERHLVAIGFICGEARGLAGNPAGWETTTTRAEESRGWPCRNCGQYGLRVLEGCVVCPSCGDSRCE